MAASNMQTIDLAHIRKSCLTQCTPTSDVKFTFVDQNTGQCLELYAHKLILAFGSEVFMAQFYGTLKEKRDIIAVDDSSFDAFKTLLDLMYNKKVTLKEMSFMFLAELFYLAHKFLMDKLQDFIINEVYTRKITSEQLLEAATVAENHKQLGRFSESVYGICVMFIRVNIESVFEIFDSEEAGGANSLILHRLMAEGNRIEHSLVRIRHRLMSIGTRVEYSVPTGTPGRGSNISSASATPAGGVTAGGMTYKEWKEKRAREKAGN
eukprot:GFUD01027841.1.p1 GENE.GFUD01027841.1~~GFUD01027841.1.p1  ORF type:complete len:284 (+),score=64.03 GFUD01027841.1:59-853(+)